MGSPLDPPEGNWWDVDLNRRESIWLAIAGGWALSMFGWMNLWTRVGEQNQTGRTRRVSPEAYREAVAAYEEQATETDRGLRPPGRDVYVGAVRYGWDGLPVVLQAGTEYDVHLGSYDVQHGFSVRKEDVLSKQLSLQVLPGYEWVVPFQFDEPGTYHVVCNEFCGVGHRTMHGRIVVEGEP